MIFPWSSHGHWTMNLSARNSTFALSSNGTVFAWGDNQDAAKGADGADGASLAAVVDKCGQWQSYDNHLLLSTDMNWQSLTMWQSFEFTARIIFSALKMERQYETQYFVMTVMISLWFLEVASDIKWHQVAKMTKCRWKCVTSLILRPQVEEWPTKLTLLQETRVPKIPVVFCHVLPTLRLIVSVRKHRMLWTMSESDCIWCPGGGSGFTDLAWFGCLGDFICRSESWKSSMARPLLRTFVPETKMQSWKNQQVATDTSSYTYTAVYCSALLRHTGSHFDHFSSPSTAHLLGSQGAESETNFGRYETVPEDGGQAIGIERFWKFHCDSFDMLQLQV